MVFEHSQDFSYPIHPGDFKIIDSGSEFDLRNLESIHISDKNPSLNNRFSSYDLAILKPRTHWDSFHQMHGTFPPDSLTFSTSLFFTGLKLRIFLHSACSIISTDTPDSFVFC